ncbi:MAG: amidohydrolase [Geminicoccaceae bacterium]|nr:MAG: amidohydrolase [Geminicoccaceae bacterium]
MRIEADLVLRGGRIWCGAEIGAAGSLAAFGGKVLATAANGDLDDLIGPRTRVIDLEGRLATPGLYDVHLHLLPLGLYMAQVDLRPKSAPTLDALLQAMADRAAAQPKGSWVIGAGYDHFKLDVGRHPTRTELDRAVPDHPVYVVRTCGHLAVCNSLALQLAGIDADTPSPPGGLIELVDGELTGLLAENGRDAVKAVLPEPSQDDLVEAIERAGRYCLSFGVTSVMDAAVGMRAGFAEIGAYFRAKREGRLPVRVDMCLLGGDGGIAERCFEAGLVTGTGDAELRVGPVKIFTDGSAGGRTAAMVEDYQGGGKGILCLEDGALNAFVERYHGQGYQMAIHAIGDAAIEQVLNAYELALAARPWPDRRHRIEHCGFSTAQQIERMVRLGIYPAPQPSFMYDFGDLYVDVLGEARAAGAYPMRTWLSAGLQPSASTDCPVTDVNPFPNLYSMVTRRTDRGTLLGGQERLTMAEALTAYTVSSAFAGRSEQEKGRLVPGQLADVAVFDTDLLAAEPEAVLQASCDLAIKGGEVVFDRHAMVG